MEVRFAAADLKRLEEEPDFDGGFPKEIVRKYRMRLQFIRAAIDEREFYAMKSLHYEKLKGKRSHQRSMRLNNQWRLIIEIAKADPANLVVIVSIEDYH